MVFDPTYPSIDNDDFPRPDWEKHYGEVKEVIQTNSPAPRGNIFNVIGYVDAYLAGDKVVRRSRTVFYILEPSAHLLVLKAIEQGRM